MHKYKLTLFLTFFVVTVTEKVAAAADPAKGEPPEIVDFLKGDLDKVSEEFKIPCKATGTKPLTWTWKKNGANFPWGRNSEVSSDGTLTVEYIRQWDDGVYQCFVKNAFGETYSRKVKVKVTVLGRFFEREDMAPKEVEVTIGKPAIVPCPEHRYSYGHYYSWGTKDRSLVHSIVVSETEHRFVTQNGTLVFTWLSADDVNFVNAYNGVSCKIEGGNRIYRSRKIKFKVVGPAFTGYVPTTFYSKPDAVIRGTQGEMVSLYCAALGKPSPSIVWFKDNNRIVSGQNGVTLKFFNRHFQILNPGRRNHGNYKCQATNTNPTNNVVTTIMHPFQIVIRSPPEWIRKPNSREHIAIGSSLTLTCEADGYPSPGYTWRKNGKVISSSAHVQVNGGILKIISGRERNDSGVYHCDAENQVGHLVASTWLKVSAEPPRITNFLQYNLDYPTAVVGEHSDRGFELPCKAAGTKPLKWTWKIGRRGKKLTIDGVKFILKADGTLVGRSLEAKDTNFYQCEVSNKQGTVFSRRIRVRVSGTGKFHGKPNDMVPIDVTVGKPLVVDCPLHSHNYGYEILWEGVSDSSGTAHTFHIREGDQGQLVYSYLSRNDLNETQKNGGLQCVLKSGNIKERSPKYVLKEVGNEFTGDVKPSFYFKDPTRLKVIGGNEMTMLCNVTGKPDVTIEWEFNSNKIVDGTNSFSTSKYPAHLIIDKTEKSKHEGSYRCIATNSAGTTTSPDISLLVYDPPKLVIKPKTEEKIDEGQDVSLQCKVDSGGRRPLTPKWYRNGIRAQVSSRLTINGGILNITNAILADSGVYQCVAESRLGMAVSATALYVIQP